MNQMNMKTQMANVASTFPQTPQEAITFNAVESETRHMNVLERSFEMQEEMVTT